jgi:serine O-acetyltransferase
VIKSKSDLSVYLNADKKSRANLVGFWSQTTDEIWQFHKLLRRLEHASNLRVNFAYRNYLRFRFKRKSVRLGFTIPINVTGPGLSLPHFGSITINGGARIGANCRIHNGVNIGTEAGKSNTAPTIGDNCYIGPGAKIFGDIVIGPNTVIGANAVVNKSFPEGNQTIAGIPAKIVSQKSSEGLLIKGFPL